MEVKRPIVLCVDDDPDDQMLVLETIREQDPTIRVAAAINGIEAMTFLYGAKEQGGLPCLVIMDINMPLMDGKQALSLIKKDDVLKDVPVVLFTTSSSSLDQSFAAHHGVACITKPVHYNELKETVKKLLNSCLAR